MKQMIPLLRLLPRLLAGAALLVALGPLEPARAASPPTADLALWLKADSGVTTAAGNQVTAWADQAGGTDNSATPIAGSDPQLAEASFANGPHPVIRFSGNDGFDLLNSVELEVPSLSVYVVGSVNSSVASEIFVGHFKPTFGWALGISDSIPGRVKWFTSPPQSLEPVGGSLANNVPTILAGTFAGGTKTLYVNGTEAGSVGGLSLDYGGGGGVLTVGYLGCCGGIQKLQGDIAEVLVYSSVSAQQRTEVEAYLKEKYIDPRPPGDGLRLWLRADEGVQTSDGVNVTSWDDQAGGVLNNGVATGAPTLQSADFPGGPRPVIRLDGASGLTLDNVSDLDLPSISIYVVGSVDNTRTAQTFISNLRQPYGFSLGVSLTTPGRARFYTGVPENTLESPGADLPNFLPFLLAGTFDDASTVKRLYLGGIEVASQTGVDLNSATENVLAVGYEKGFQNPLAGDIAEILVYSTVSDAQRTAVELYLRLKYFGSGVGPAIITGQPESRQVNELAPVSFTVVADGAGPLSYQWSKNGTPIPGATAPVYGINAALRTDAGSYTVRVSNSVGGPTTSDPAILTVIEDNAPPTLVSATRDFASPTTLNVFFSERLRADTANVAINYGLDRGATIGAAAISGAGDSVVLTTSALTPGTYTLTVNNVRDRVGNLIAPNSKVTFEVVNLPVPSQDLRLWLRADAGVGTADGVSVSTWADQGGGVLNNGTAFGPAQPQIREELFPTGLRPVIRFGDPDFSGFNLQNSGDLRPEQLTIYVVASIWEASPSKIFIGNYRDVAGWAVGISDGIGGRVKWFTAPPNSMEPPDPPPVGADLAIDTPYLLTASYQNGNKRLYIDGTDFDSTLIGEANDIPLSYAADTGLTVGTLQGGRQWLRGSIAEILVYSSVNSAQKAAVEGYLTRKYFGGGSGPPVITFQPQDTAVDEFSPVTFEVGVDGSSPFTYQWFKGSDAIPGAERSTYTIQSTTRDDAGEYSVRVENGDGSVQSRRAVLSFKLLDITGPTLVSAKRSSLDITRVTVVFSETLDAASAATAGNYRINGVIVANAVPGGDSASVVLTASSPLVSGSTYTLAVTGVRDRALNAITPGSTIPVQLPSAVTIAPPATDQILWLKADEGVVASEAGTVLTWADQAGDIVNNGNPVGTAQLAEAEFPTGLRPVVRFDGGGGFELENPADLERTDLSVYVVGSVNSAVASEIFISHFKPTFGWALGISDGVAGRVKWFTSPPHSLEPAGASLGNHVPTYLTGTFTGGTKKLFVDGVEAGSVAGLSLDYGGGGGLLTVGHLGCCGNAQRLQGDIAEILVYSTVSEQQRTGVEDYLRQKYLPNPTPPALLRQQDSGPDGLLVLEAEHYDRTVAAGGSEWVLTTATPGFSGPGAMVALPNSGRNVNVDISVSPRLEYNVRFARSGIHYVWVRGLGDSLPGPSADDSVNVGLDRQLPESSDRITTFPLGSGYVWTSATVDAVPATIDVPTAGPHIVTVWMREDGLIVDKLLLTSNAAYTPTGAGPSESPLLGTGLSPISIVASGADVVMTWTEPGATLQGAPTVKGPWTTAATVSPFRVAASQAARFYRLTK